MEPQERKRYIRQIILPEMGLAGQEKLTAAKVLVVGAGGLGCPVLQYLTAAGVGTIGVIDDDTVDVTNLHRQILYSAADIGKGKAETAVQKLAAMNPYINLIALPIRLNEENVTEIFSDYDLIIDGSDNFPTRYLTNDACVVLNKPLVFGSILRFEGQVSVFNYNNGPTYRCLFPDAEEGDNCEVAGVIGILPGIIGTYMANEAIKVICGIGEILSGKLLVINALTNETNIFQFDKINNVTASVSTQNSVTVEAKKHTSGSEEILFEDFERLVQVNADQIFLVDVREEYEFEEDFIGGINIPLPDLPDNFTRIPTDKTVVFYCRSGIRSQKAANLLKENLLPGKGFWMKES